MLNLVLPMKKKDAQKYFDKQYESMRSCLDGFLQNRDQEELHRFRVQVKKLRAFMVLQPGKKSGKQLKPIVQIFKKAGEIRNIFLNVQLVLEHAENNDAFILQQRHEMDALIASFKLNGIAFMEVVDGSRNTSLNSIDSVADLHINMFYQQQLHHIDTVFRHIIFNDELHHCRKLLKQLTYNYKLVQPWLMVKLNEDYLEEIQTAIGDWHDNILATDLFKDNVKIVEVLKRQSEELKKKIIELAADFFERATTSVEMGLEQLD